MKNSCLAIVISILALTGCNEEELKTLKTQNEELRAEIEGLRSNGEALQSGKTDLQAEISSLKASLGNDYVAKAELDAQSDNLEAANAKMEASQSDLAVARAEIESLKKQKEGLATKLDEQINGAEKLYAEAEKEFADKNYEAAKEKLSTLLKKHPDYPAKNKVTELAEKIAKQEALADTGDWTVGRFVDEFGEETGKRYIAHVFKGRMSNSATQDAALAVSVTADKDTIYFQLYPYGGDSPETWFRTEWWTWTAQDSEKKRVTQRRSLKTEPEGLL